jgi:L-iditol 2-dehydrogenase
MTDRSYFSADGMDESQMKGKTGMGQKGRMKALVKKETGPGHVELDEVTVPAVGPEDVKVRIKACGICGTDLHMMHGAGWTFIPPVTLGHEFSGEIVEVGSRVERWSVGDRVTAEPPASTCGVCDYCLSGYPALCDERRSIGSGVNGAFAEYLVIPQRRLHRLYDEVDDISASLSEPAACCVHAVLEVGNVSAGDVVLVTGPGPIGLLVSQIAGINGAEVVLVGTEVDRDRLDLATRLGIDRTVTVGAEEVERAVRERNRDRGADVAFECSGAYPAYETCVRSLRKHGTLVQMGLFPQAGTVDLAHIIKKELTTKGSFGSTHSSFETTLRLMAKGLLQIEPLVTATLPLTDWKRGFEMMENRQACKVVLIP